MMSFEEKLIKVQESLQKEGLDGWLFFDFHRSNDIAIDFLEFPENKLATRRLFYWIPAAGIPQKIIHRVEEENLDHLPGKKRPYLSWQELEQHLEEILDGKRRIAMEYSPRNAIPYLSKVDAGTMEVIWSFGVTVVSSADLLQQHSELINTEQAQSHFEATKILDQTVAKAWQLIAQRLRDDEKITEYDVQQFILAEFKANDCITVETPIVGVNANSADPHYAPTEYLHESIQKGDFILIDLWCRKNRQASIFGDITRVGIAAKEPTKKQKEVFDIVNEARYAAINLVKERFSTGEPLMGSEVDDASRKVIKDAGYGERFIHRTGHNIHTNLHGNGTHIDNLETQDSRRLLSGTCFSIEPGIYLPGEFGVRLECDVFVEKDSTVHVTGGLQEKITPVMALLEEEVHGT